MNNSTNSNVLMTILSNEALMWITLKEALFHSSTNLTSEQCNAAATITADLLKKIFNDENFLSKLQKDAEIYQI